MIRLVIITLLLLATGQPASAALSRAELAGVGAAPVPDARVPLSLSFFDLQGRSRTLAEETAGRPALLILADYRCTQLCGSILGIAGRALSGVGLSPQRDFSLVVVGFNPDAGAADGTAMGDAELAGYPEVEADAHLLTGSTASLAVLQKALGFTAVRDPGADRFAHPIDVYVLTPDGRVSRVLNGLSLDPDTVRLALVEAGQGRIGSLFDRLHVLCYGLDPLSGSSTGLAQGMLRVGASLTLLCAVGVGFLAMRRRGAASLGSNDNALTLSRSRSDQVEASARREPLASPSTGLLRSTLRMGEQECGQAVRNMGVNSLSGPRP